MARFTISLGRCGFCDALAGRFSPLAGDARRPARICRACVTRFVDPPRSLPALVDISEDIAPTRFWRSDSARDLPAEPAEQVSVVDVLRAFRKRVDEVIGTDDREARYNLGIAYYEMGLLDEAIDEFEIASAEPALGAECRALIGICFRAQGHTDRAIQSFSSAIKAPGISDGQKAVFFFELAVSLESVGERAKARKMMKQVRLLDPAFPRALPVADNDRDFRSVREAFAGGGSRDAYRNSREDDSGSGVLFDLAALETKLRTEPEHVRARITLAALCVKLGRTTVAAHHYLLAAVGYRRAGSPLKAVAAYEMVLRIGVSGLVAQAHVGLAELCDEMGTLEAESHRRAAREAGDGATGDLAPICSFCDLPQSLLRPPAQSETTTICADCIAEARELFSHTPTA